MAKSTDFLNFLIIFITISTLVCAGVQPNQSQSQSQPQIRQQQHQPNANANNRQQKSSMHPQLQARSQAKVQPQVEKQPEVPAQVQVQAKDKDKVNVDVKPPMPAPHKIQIQPKKPIKNNPGNVKITQHDGWCGDDTCTEEECCVARKNFNSYTLECQPLAKLNKPCSVESPGNWTFYSNCNCAPEYTCSGSVSKRCRPAEL